MMERECRGVVRTIGLTLLLAAVGGCDTPSEGTPDGLPPDPGEQGTITIEGIDRDGDGVRDDVQRHIVLTYSDQGTRDALFQIARPQLRSLLQTTDKQAVLEHTEAMAAGVACLYAVTATANARDALVELESVILNTESRIRASYVADGHAGGETFVLPQEVGTDTCE